jgi:hypothetical protein
MLQGVKADAHDPRRPRTRIQSVSRAVQVLRYVAELEEGPATLSGIAAVVGTPLPTAYHLLATLVDEGMLVPDPKRGYRLGSTVGVLGDAFRREPPSQRDCSIRCANSPPRPARTAASLPGRTAKSRCCGRWRDGSASASPRSRPASPPSRTPGRPESVRAGPGGDPRQRIRGRRRGVHGRLGMNRNRLLRATRSAARLAEVYSAQAVGEDDGVRA